jgi:hypothetical protein
MMNANSMFWWGLPMTGVQSPIQALAKTKGAETQTRNKNNTKIVKKLMFNKSNIPTKTTGKAVAINLNSISNFWPRKICKSWPSSIQQWIHVREHLRDEMIQNKGIDVQFNTNTNPPEMPTKWSVMVF